MMDSKHQLAEELRRYIVTSIPSVPYLEALLLLRSESGRAWSLIQVAQRLYVNVAKARELVEQLVQARFVEADGSGCRYAPASAELSDLADELARAYLRDLPGISQLIHSRSDRLAAQFAQAFRLRNDE